ncbi:MAG: metallophosphoesterase family protein [Candidatus Tectimicrobiota bacterium]
MTHARYIVIGDVHGCLLELRALIRRIQPRADDTFVFLGDLLDKGPHSPAVVRWIRHFARRYRVVLIEGNHEEKHRRWRQHMRLGSPVAHTMTGTPQMAAITQAMSAEDIAFLETGRLYFRMPPYHALAVHAGVPPALARLPENPGEIDTYARKECELYMKMQRIRFVSPEGKIVQLGHETARDRYWADTYDGRLGTVYFGHQVFLTSCPVAFPHAVGLDLGAVHGGYLAAAILSEQGMTYEVEPARWVYA